MNRNKSFITFKIETRFQIHWLPFKLWDCNKNEKKKYALPYQQRQMKFNFMEIIINTSVNLFRFWRKVQKVWDNLQFELLFECYKTDQTSSLFSESMYVVYEFSNFNHSLINEHIYAHFTYTCIRSISIRRSSIVIKTLYFMMEDARFEKPTDI